MQRSDIELSGIQFPTSAREDGAVVEILQLEARKSVASRNVEDWISENSKPENPWRVISFSKSKEKSMFLVLSERRVVRMRYKIQAGKLTKVEEEAREPEIGEIHLRRSGLLELYSVPAKQRRSVFTSLTEFFGGKDMLSTLYLEKDAMTSLIEDATEVSSVSLSGIGNPFFSEVTLSGQDPVNSRTFKELVPSATIKSFRAKLQTDSSDKENSSGGLMLVSVANNCRVRFYGGRAPVPQSSIEDYLSSVRKFATNSSAET